MLRRPGRHRPFPTGLPTSRRRAGRALGFTTIELMIGLVLLAILAALALPSYQQHLRRLRRSEALTAVALIQQAQERRRAEQPTYADSLGSSSGLAMASTSPGGLYALATASTTGSEASSYSVSATAQGTQVADLPCTHLRVDVSAGTITYSSGGSSLLDNDAAVNRRCWNQ